jgi:Uma2 family endonuclease
MATHVTFISETAQLVLPAWVGDIDSFRHWTEMDDFPETGSIWWLRGEVWADMSKEQIFTHIGVKTEYTSVLHRLARQEQKGTVFSDGLLISNFAADISGNPDLTFIAYETLQSDRVRLIEGDKEGYTEIQGSPDMVLEIVSRGSVQKDTVILRQAYWEADIPEYWLVDARQEAASFTILRHTARGYVSVPRRGGWIKSQVFGKEFKLLQSTSPAGHPEYILQVR